MGPIGTTPERRIGRILGYGLPGAFLGLALAWALGIAPPRGVQADAASGMTGSMIALSVAAPGDVAASRIVLIDTKAQSMAVYKIDSGRGGAIKLEAARRIGSDLKLSEYNNLPPEVAAVEAMVTGPRLRGNSGQ